MKKRRIRRLEDQATLPLDSTQLHSIQLLPASLGNYPGSKTVRQDL